MAPGRLLPAAEPRLRRNRRPDLRPSGHARVKGSQDPDGHGSKKAGSPWVALGSGNMGRNLRNLSFLILSHCQTRTQSGSMLGVSGNSSTPPRKRQVSMEPEGPVRQLVQTSTPKRQVPCGWEGCCFTTEICAFAWAVKELRRDMPCKTFVCEKLQRSCQKICRCLSKLKARCTRRNSFHSDSAATSSDFSHCLKSGLAMPFEISLPSSAARSKTALSLS